MFTLTRSDEFMISFQYLMLDPKLKVLIGSIQQPINSINKQNVHPLHMIMATNCMVSHKLHAAHVEELSLLALVVHSAQTACSMNTKGASCCHVAAIRHAGVCLHKGFHKMPFQKNSFSWKETTFSESDGDTTFYDHQLYSETNDVAHFQRVNKTE